MSYPSSTGRLTIAWFGHEGPGYGGAERSLIEGKQALERRGLRVHVVLPLIPAADSILAGLERYSVVRGASWLSDRPSLKTRLRCAARNVWRGAPKACSLLRKIKPDAVISNSISYPLGAIAARVCGFPHIWYLREFGDLDYERTFHFGKRMTAGLVDRLSHVVAVNSQAVGNHFGRWIPRDKIMLVRNAVDVPEIVKAKRVISDGVLQLIFLGYRTPTKGAVDAIQALAILADRGVCASLQMVGKGNVEYDQHLSRIASDRGVERLISREPFAVNPYQLLADAHVGLVCSRSEAFGRVTVEAMKVGTVVVGTRSGGTCELIRDGETGMLYSPGNAEELASQIERLYRNRTFFEELRSNAERFARKTFSLGQYGADLERAVFRSIACSRHGKLIPLAQHVS